jgi:hypothetical protein
LYEKPRPPENTKRGGTKFTYPIVGEKKSRRGRRKGKRRRRNIKLEET